MHQRSKTHCEKRCKFFLWETLTMNYQQMHIFKFMFQGSIVASGRKEWMIKDWKQRSINVPATNHMYTHPIGNKRARKAHVYAPATIWAGHKVLSLSVRTFICPFVIHCSTIVVSASPPTVFDAGIWNLQYSSDMHWTCAQRKQNFDSDHYRWIISHKITY